MIREDLLRTVRDLSARHDTKAFAELVESVHPSDMAEALETLKSRDVARLLPCLKAGALAEVFVYFSEERQSRLLQELPRETVVAPVSYTHLDVYKRQSLPCWAGWACS